MTDRDPRCPLMNCNIGRNPSTQNRTTQVLADEATKWCIDASQPLFRCTYCAGVWREPKTDVIELLGKITHIPDPPFEPYSHPERIELARGRHYVAALDDPSN